MKHLLSLLMVGIMSLNTYAQKVSLSIGTDIPYQHYVGATLNTKHLDFSYRTGLLIPPYSNLILNTIQSLGVDDVYIRLLESAYDVGWMNTLGAYYKFGKSQKWFGGIEFRLDRLSASDTPVDLLESITGQQIALSARREVQVQLGLTMYALGMRFGRYFSLGKSNKRFIRAEIGTGGYRNSSIVQQVVAKCE